MTLNPALQGPELGQTQYVLRPPQPFQTLIPGGAPPYSSAAQPDAGLVSLDIRPQLDAVQEPDLPKIFPPGTDLSDVVLPRQVVPGSHAFYAVTLGSESKTLGEGGYRTRRRVRSDDRDRRARRGRCLSRRRKIVTVRAHTIPGARITRVRAYVNGRRARSRLLRPKKGRASALRHRRVRVRLRRTRARRLRITVVVRQARGFRTKTTRRYRRCPRR